MSEGKFKSHGCEVDSFESSSGDGHMVKFNRSDGLGGLKANMSASNLSANQNTGTNVKNRRRRNNNTT